MVLYWTVVIKKNAVCDVEFNKYILLVNYYKFNYVCK